ncbi:MAG TPA: putative RNA uridine N3 methyltransferase, partial [Nitrososphaerales archaeon]|nr:putative RNA uridine N3 methyltransferase [Nitrososphaerales archaeon]
CAIYGVDVVEVFRDPGGKGEGQLIRRVLEYLETPQYLRRRLFPIEESLKYAGALPPLRIPSHKPKVTAADLGVGEVREGVANGDGTVDVGLDIAPRLDAKVARGRRVTVKIVSSSPLVARQIPKEGAGAYWGYAVEGKSADEVLDDPRFKVKIATSRLGTPLREALGQLRPALGKADGAKMIFGSPRRGLYDVYGSGLPRRVQFVINLFPDQRVETVRTEEAILAALGLVTVVYSEKA